ncbi:hypothetical protein [uncultured Nocardioides sp.]|uniref:hypothetical protein n=1 Tax=uncultured Nocardioides sp. TaxID=198441 RepID=UPI0026177A6D|nr:hypothetical protein [uncultured Nocardioides sp.]
MREQVSPWPFAALVGMTAVLFLYGVAFGVLPWWAGLLLLAVWAGLLAVVLRWFRTRPRATVLVPVVALAVWFAAVTGGARLLS